MLIKSKTRTASSRRNITGFVDAVVRRLSVAGATEVAEVGDSGSKRRDSGVAQWEIGSGSAGWYWRMSRYVGSVSIYNL